MALKLISALLLGFACASPYPRDDSRFSFYEMPTAFAGPCDLATGPDGNIWVQDILVDKVAKIDVKTGKVTEYDIPYNSAANKSILTPPEILGRTALACAIQPGADGKLYAASGLRNQFSRIDPSTGHIEVFTPTPYNPAGDLLFLNDLYTYHDAMYFTMTTGGKLARFDFASSTFEYFDVPGGGLSLPVGVFTASDNKIYVPLFGSQQITRFDPAKKVFDATWPVPSPAGLGPAVVRAETEGRYVWFTAFEGNGMCNVDIKTEKLTCYEADVPASFPTEDTVDSKGNVWYSTPLQNTLNYIDPQHKFHHITQPGNIVTLPASLPPAADIAVHYGPLNSIWFTEVAANKVGRYQL